MFKKWFAILMALFAMFNAGCHAAGSSSVGFGGDAVKLVGNYDVTVTGEVMGFTLPVLIDFQFPPGSAVTYNDVMRNYTAKLLELGVAPDVAADMVRAEVLAYMEDAPKEKTPLLAVVTP